MTEAESTVEETTEPVETSVALTELVESTTEPVTESTVEPTN